MPPDDTQNLPVEVQASLEFNRAAISIGYAVPQELQTVFLRIMQKLIATIQGQGKATLIVSFNFLNQVLQDHEKTLPLALVSRIQSLCKFIETGKMDQTVMESRARTVQEFHESQQREGGSGSESGEGNAES